MVVPRSRGLGGFGGSGPSSSGSSTEVDHLPVGCLVSLLRSQNCTGYTPLDVDGLGQSLFALRRAAEQRPQSNHGKPDLRRFWRGVRSQVRRRMRRRRGASDSDSRSESDGSCGRSRSRGRGRRGRSASGDGGRHRGREVEQKAQVEVKEQKEEVEFASKEVEAFIVYNNLDDDAARYLRKSPPEVQSYAIACGTLHICKNPSSALMRRIMDGKRMHTHQQAIATMNAARFNGQLAAQHAPQSHQSLPPPVRR